VVAAVREKASSIAVRVPGRYRDHCIPILSALTNGWRMCVGACRYNKNVMERLGASKLIRDVTRLARTAIARA
jgi:hypothetical protein